MKDDYYLKMYQINYFQTLIIIHLLHWCLSIYICKVLLEGSIDASYDENTSILDDVFKYIDSTKRLNTFQELIDTSTDN